MSHNRPLPHHLLRADTPSPALSDSYPSTEDVSVAALAGGISAAQLSHAGIVPCLQALQAVEDAPVRRALTAEVHELMAAQWRKNSRYKSTMAKHLVEDVRQTRAMQT
jgi:hypothetical protein